MQAKERLDEFFAALPPKPSMTLRTRVKWKPLNANLFKINFEGEIFKNENRSSMGVVIQDHNGFIIASLTQQISQAL